jgi:(1->4)-alpha-D-glucan 1-alpha-D-glucosylmutase
MEHLFPAEIKALACNLHKLVSSNFQPSKISLESLKGALIDFIACLSVYRTYIRSYHISKMDRYYLSCAFQEAGKRITSLEKNSLDILNKVLMLDFPPEFQPEQKKTWLNFVMRWQQFTGPIIAKGLEDTALYSYSRLISMNVIGAAQQLSPITVKKFHDFNKYQYIHWPHTLNATSTHDSKRSEDISARINVLSEMPGEWITHLSRWRELNRLKQPVVKGITVPEPDMESLLYQTLIGSWPFKSEEVPDFKERFKGFLLKAVKEAKSSTSWIDPNPDYENSIRSFVDNILNTSSKNEFLDDFLPFQKRIAFYGALNSLSQLVLKVTSPGLPDFYQGTEVWNLNLVDPDNRRAVDFQKNQDCLDEILNRKKQELALLLEDIQTNWMDGRIKLYTAHKSLNTRRNHFNLFTYGEYLPLKVGGGQSRQVMAFARRNTDSWAIVVVPLFSSGLAYPGKLSLDSSAWGDSFIYVLDSAPKTWTQIFTNQTIKTVYRKPILRLSDVFNSFPVALLVNIE